MPPVGRPGGVFVPTFARKGGHAMIARVDGHDLKCTVYQGLERDRSTVGRPVGIGAIWLITRRRRRKQVRVRTVRVHNIYLGMPRAVRLKRDASTIGAERRLLADDASATDCQTLGRVLSERDDSEEIEAVRAG